MGPALYATVRLWAWPPMVILTYYSVIVLNVYGLHLKYIPHLFRLVCLFVRLFCLGVWSYPSLSFPLRNLFSRTEFWTCFGAWGQQRAGSPVAPRVWVWFTLLSFPFFVMFHIFSRVLYKMLYCQRAHLFGGVPLCAQGNPPFVGSSPPAELLKGFSFVLRTFPFGWKVSAVI